MRKKKRLLWQLFPSYLLIILLSLIAVTWYASNSLRNFFLDQTAADLLTRARLLENQILQFLGPFESNVIDALCKEIGSASATRITVILPSGIVIGDSNEDPALMDNHALRSEVILAIKGNVGKSIRFSKTLQKRMMYVAIPLKDSKMIIAVIRTSLPVTAIDDAMKSIQARITLGGLLIALLAAGVSLYVSRRISRPIEQVKEGAEFFARGDLSHRLPGTDLVEISGLADAMNEMAARLDDRIKKVVTQRNELEAVLSSMVEGVMALDMNERIVSTNKAAAEIFESSPEKLLNCPVQEVIRNPDLQKFLTRALTSEDYLEDDITLFQKGEQILHAHSAPLLDSSDRRRGILVVLNDVTQLRKLENIRKDFAANVSHEIKTPLTAIKGFVETLRHNKMENPEEARRFLGIIEKHVNRLTAIIDDLMKLSKIEQQDEKSEIQIKNSSIKNVIQSAIQRCREKADAKQITIDLECDEAISARIDVTLIEQAVFNLLDNAINYSSGKSDIRISADLKDLALTIKIQDHGIGIPKDHLSRIFERFYRVDKARSRNLGGTGLGLAIVKHIAQAHGGHVSVESTSGKGSTFSLHLPKR